jgi:hypothetical protein
MHHIGGFALDPFYLARKRKGEHNDELLEHWHYYSGHNNHAPHVCACHAVLWTLA